MVPVRSQWGGYNLPRYIYIYIIYYERTKIFCVPKNECKCCTQITVLDLRLEKYLWSHYVPKPPWIHRAVCFEFTNPLYPWGNPNVGHPSCINDVPRIHSNSQDLHFLLADVEGKLGAKRGLISMSHQWLSLKPFLVPSRINHILIHLTSFHIYRYHYIH